MAPTTEADLLARFVQHGTDHVEGRDAMDGLIRSYVDFVCGVARRATRNEALAEDVTQVVFLIFVRKAGSLYFLHRSCVILPKPLEPLCRCQ